MNCPMHPLAEISPQKWRQVRALFFDIDDTFTTHGKITAAAFSSLWRAHRAGVPLVAVTGRPAGWCDHIARMWPVAGVVGENGAIAFYYDGKKLRRIDQFSLSQRQQNRHRLARLAKIILSTVKGSALASDQPYREYDLAIDYNEDVAPLDSEDQQRILEIFARHGATAKLSSVHINGWFGHYDKVQMSRRFAREILHLKDLSQVAFVGDSPNDHPMFAAVGLAIGVANIKKFISQMKHPSEYVTRAAYGAGFAQVVNALLNAREK